ncbi:globin [Paenibacillus antri]|uniref:Globin n=1 Tax=Paenibacillus antri TaxID=2582848 RepID=A0A5R9GGB9_9BACL|nr:globin [Paenibacillus antri]TLS52344.1 globin [Paenibacillus antri]
MFENNPYAAIGGAETVRKLVTAFYPKVYADPDLSPLFPDGVDEIMRKQELFLTQFLGGPTLYSDRYGPPMMRQRHLAFEVTPRRAAAWLRCMKEAMDDIGLEGPAREWFYERLTQVAGYMVNRPDDGTRIESEAPRR